MVTIHLHKLGSNYYAGKEDRNGGAAEYFYIYKALAEASHDIGNFSPMLLPTQAEKEAGKVITFVLNGKFEPTDRQRFEAIRKASDMVVFICTDYGLIQENKEFITACDYVLHQSPDKEFKIFNKPGSYSYVPELFYDTTIPHAEMQMNLCFFGGNETGREEEFFEYIRDEETANTVRDRIACFYKSRSGNDFRVRYEDYRRMLSMFKFAFVSGRNAGKEVGWVTPRLVEVVNAGSIPILIGDYDKYNHFGFDANRVNDYKELIEFMDSREPNEWSQLASYQALFEEGKLTFKEQIKTISLMKKPVQKKKRVV